MITIYTISGLCQPGKEPFVNHISKFFLEKKKTYSYFQIPVKLHDAIGCQSKKCCYESFPIIVAAYYSYEKNLKRNRKEEPQLEELKEKYLLERIEHCQLKDLASEYKITDYKLPVLDIEKILQGEQAWVEYSECVFLHLERLQTAEPSN